MNDILKQTLHDIVTFKMPPTTYCGELSSVVTTAIRADERYEVKEVFYVADGILVELFDKVHNQSYEIKVKCVKA